MIITDPEHWRLRLKWGDYHSIIAQRTPYKSHNAKRAWFVLVFDVIMQWVYWRLVCARGELFGITVVHLFLISGNVYNGSLLANLDSQRVIWSKLVRLVVWIFWIWWWNWNVDLNDSGSLLLIKSSINRA